MYYPTLPEFLKLTKTANVIPVYKEIKGDLDTPVSLFLKLRKDEYAFLLESVEGQEHIARYSFLGSKPSLIVQTKGRQVQIVHHGTSVNDYSGGTGSRKTWTNRFVTSADPLIEIKKIMRGFKAAHIKGLPRFYGGFVGYIGYDMVRFFEDIPDKNPDELDVPDSVLILTTNIVVFDHVNHTIKIIANTILPQSGRTTIALKHKIYRQALRDIEAVHEDFKKALALGNKKTSGRAAATVESNFKKREFCAIVDKAKEYIRKGDIIQVVLSQRFRVKVNKEALDIYRNLRSLNPSPYMFFLKLKDITLIGSSPELLVRCEDGVVETRPIAGTRRRGASEEEDARLAEELLSDQKERAEHIMLVDLGRNDIGRVAQLGKVKVTDFMKVERYSHVMHLVSGVSATLEKGNDIYDALRGCFPAGTVSGSPKVRAMEIIDELENLRRGPYAGCVGYFSFSHNMDTCITIRTIVIKGDTAYIQAGAGIVADSVPEREYTETVNKARALIEAIG